MIHFIDLAMSTRRALKTLSLCVSYLTMGCLDAVRGPTLLDLKDKLNVNLEEITWILPAFSIGSILGGLIAGIVLEKFESKSFLIISGNQFVMAITAGALTLCTSLWSMCIVSGMQGATLGALDAVGTVLCLNIWSGSQYKSDPFVHSLHFSFALGALLSPLIAAQFLSERFADSALQPYNGKVHIPYLIMSGLCLISALINVPFHFDTQNSHPEKETTNGKNEPTSSPTFGYGNWRSFSMLTSLCLFFFVYVGLEVGYGSFVSTFGVLSLSLSLSRSQSALVSTFFWSGIALMRLLACFITLRIPPMGLMGMNLILTVTASGMLVIWGQTSAQWLACISAILGLGLATVFATTFTWLGKMMVITNRMGAMFSIAGSIGADIFPLIFGQIIGLDPSYFQFLIFGSVMACLLLFALAYQLARKSIKE
ncbi:sodium-dependent glucose transporter 1-like [Tigriopus californicus]|uniref:sodium-dependent glucose transporter 1-like n=1 Tax=Tigriopus californicus TaxID=6832 RepID=UPI0027D9F55A|nr:sodium-dependent glucose transporter 1-like [Tigriopus californicus]